MSRIETRLRRIVEATTAPPCPPRLAEAIAYAVFPGGARLRPRLAHAIALAEGRGDNAWVEVVAAAVELVHCASLVHDDLPCFDDALMRRGSPSVHRKFGEGLAVLTGDALIVAGLGALCEDSPDADRTVAAMSLLARAAGAPFGISAGQGWEAEPIVDLETYHGSKTAALFEAAAALGALAAGADPSPWTSVGRRIGLAYQAVDDIRDVRGDADSVGKPTGRDELLGRPNVALAGGVASGIERVRGHIDAASEHVPPCADPRHVLRFLQELRECLVR